MTPIDTPIAAPRARGPLFLLRCVAGGALLAGTFVAAVVLAPGEVLGGLIYAGLRAGVGAIGATLLVPFPRLRARLAARAAARDEAKAMRRERVALRSAALGRRVRAAWTTTPKAREPQGTRPAP